MSYASLEKRIKSAPEGCLDEMPDHTDKKEIMAIKGEGDITDSFGSLSLSVDPLEFQRSVREEWE